MNEANRSRIWLAGSIVVSLARDHRNAARQNLQAVLTAARHVEATARSHREQLAASMAAYDAALIQLTALHLAVEVNGVVQARAPDVVGAGSSQCHVWPMSGWSSHRRV